MTSPSLPVPDLKVLQELQQPLSIQHVVLTVHGIRTFGKWQERLEVLIKEKEPNALVPNYKYGYFSVIAFLIPFVRWMVTRKFRSTLKSLWGRFPDARIDVVAHSFGTHLLGRGLLGIPPKKRGKLHTVILAGSVLKPDFPWGDLIQNGTVSRVINECGVDDRVLLANQIFVLFTGMAGRLGLTGMMTDELLNNWYAFGHSGYFTKSGKPSNEFMSVRWIPLLTTRTRPTSVDERPEGWSHGFLIFLLQNAEPIKLAIYASPFILLALIYFHLYVNALHSRQIAIKEREAAIEQSHEATRQRDEATRQRDEANRRLADLFALEATRARERQNHLVARVYVAAARERFVTARTLMEGLAASEQPVTFLRDLNSPTDLQTAPAFSPTENLLAVGGMDGFVRILDSNTGKLRARLGPHHVPVTSLAFSGNGRVLAVGLARPATAPPPPPPPPPTTSPTTSPQQPTTPPPPPPRMPPCRSEETPVTVQLWDFRKRVRLALLQAGCDYPADVKSVAVNQDGSWVAAAADQLFVWNWDGVKGRVRFSLGTEGAARGAFNREGSLLAVSTWSGQVHVLRVPEFSVLFRVPPHYPLPPDVVAIPAIAFSPDGKLLIVGSDAGKVTRWRLPTGNQVSSLAGHDQGVMVNDVSFSPDGQFLATGGSDGSVLLWNACDERVLTQLDAHITPVLSLTFDRQGSRLVSTQLDTQGNFESQRLFGQSRVWQVHRDVLSPLAANIPRDVLGIFYQRNGQLLLVKLSSGRKLKLVEPGSKTVRSVWQVPAGAEVNAVGVSQDGTRMAVGLRGPPHNSGAPNLPRSRVDVIDLENGTTVATLPIPSTPFGISSVALSADGGRVAVGTTEAMEVLVWEVQTARELLRQPVASVDPVDVAFGPDGATVAWTEPGHVILYDLTSKQRREFSFQKPPPPLGIALSADGRLLAASFSDQSIILWDLSSDSVAATVSFDAACYPFSSDGWRRENAADVGARFVALNADGSRLAGFVGDQIKIWGENVPASLSEAVRQSGLCWTGAEVIRCRQPEFAHK